ncbi:MAG: hypothetical protein IT383_25005 [Deltaproteobacteria bacterium]|nr:hypothetical protein [Deltaproteobacteria bacterium]
MKVLIMVALGCTSLALASPAQAQESGRQGADRRTVIDMGEDVIEGSLRAPDGIVVPPPIRNQFRSLIQLRQDFRREILASGAQL